VGASDFSAPWIFSCFEDILKVGLLDERACFSNAINIDPGSPPHCIIQFCGFLTSGEEFQSAPEASDADLCNLGDLFSNLVPGYLY
jgi:hypothetical protein